MILGMYLLLANDPSSNISWWVDTGLNRMLLPGMTLLWLGLVDAMLASTDPVREEMPVQAHSLEPGAQADA